MTDIDYKIVAVAIDKEKTLNRSILTDDLYELSVKHGLAKIEDFFKSQNDFHYTTVTFESRAYSIESYRQEDDKSPSYLYL